MSLAVSAGGLPVSPVGDQYLGYRDAPVRAPLLPEGSPIEAYFPKLYPPNRSQQLLLDYARPGAEVFGSLLVPSVFRRRREELRRKLKAFNSPCATLAAQWLNERGEDERLLQMFIHLLVEV
ncbi:Yop protein translocation protein X [compost metagenome]